MVLFQLNNQILQRINDCKTCEKVTLTINNVEFIINKYFAVAISKMFYANYLLDNNNVSIDITTEIGTQDTYNILKDILQYRKREVECDESVCKDLFHIGVKLDINDLIEFYKNHFIDNATIDINNCFDLLEFYFDISSEEKTNECAEFISSHFFEIDENKFKTISNKLGFDIVQRIIKSDKLKIKDEDSLAKFVICLARESETFYQLIEHVRLEFCSKQIIDEIQNLSNENNYSIIINTFHDSLLRSRPPKHNYIRYNIQNEFLQNISELEKSNDFSNIYKFLDKISKDNNRIMTSIAFNELAETKDSYGFYIIHKAAEYGNLRLVERLVEHGFDIEIKNNNGDTPLIWASYYGHLEVVQYLISVGADKEAKNNNGDTALIWASRDGHLEVVQYLISVGADKEAKDNSENTPLIWASWNGHLEVVKYLISVGADKEAKNKDGWTPLIHASYYGHLEVVQYLISVGADKEAKNNNGDTALIWASRDGHLEIVQYLISVGADKEAKDNSENTPLIWASWNGHLEVVKYLISVGADKEAKNKDGWTPLIHASYYGHLEVVQYLISVGADKEAKNNNGDTALSYARDKVREYLKSIGAK
ncbi:ankyrin repeat protein, putative [Trichomonas vaginalis G3]|uniref:Ankyrin repeat protein, putative n=1 Tax=Trichomonas vaginalis (strain ATCC PRA-98 / G3) TaxID=412133 RepID=A2ELC1_TRIV3|nr:ankyrin repeat protein family [Trichomonas vaginalis G3]EAY06523.1 ankyrin repeat protein, putative [Trichomonas vaginalis G3]KAI5526092.1 ankyrin repeat protein family [Trichomonas vaginalis G3]|eukprot:XP_001318746.1 ankyrin repeat protein [Trichomonas vaginalis G3]